MRARLTALVVPALLALLAGWIFHLTVVDIPAAANAGRLAQPWPDGAEYLDVAVALAHRGEASIHLAGEDLPARFPVGYSTAIAGALLLGSDPLIAPQRTNQAAGALLLVFFVALLGLRRHYLAAGLAALLLATLPAFIILCRSPMSEVSSTLMSVVAVGLLYGFARSPTSGPGARRGVALGIVGAAILGLGLGFRTANVLLLAFLPAAILARDSGRRLKDLVLLGLAAAIGVLPLLAFNGSVFGHPLASGYSYWLPEWNASAAFSSDFVSDNLAYYGRELRQQETDYSSATHFGQQRGSYVTPAFVLLALVGLGRMWRRRRLRLFAAAGIVALAAMAFYAFHDTRLIFPLLVLPIPAIAIGLGEIFASRGRLAVPLATALLCLTVLGWPSGDGHSETTELVTTAHRRPAYPGFDSLRRFRALDEASEPGLILTDMPPPYVHAALSWRGEESRAVVAPLDDDHLYTTNPEVFQFGEAERIARISEALLAGDPVWVITAKQDIFSLASTLPPPTDYGWEVVLHTRPTSGVARLVALAPE
ncbi:MAG: hypothetical protein AAF604_22705 [Acidobacteriota bacterium]